MSRRGRGEEWEEKRRSQREDEFGGVKGEARRSGNGDRFGLYEPVWIYEQSNWIRSNDVHSY